MSVTTKPAAKKSDLISETTTLPVSSAIGTEFPVTITAQADKTEEYAVGGPSFWYQGGARVLPWNIDDLTRDFGDSIYERMLWDPLVKAAHVVLKKSILASGISILPAQVGKDKAKIKRAQDIRDRVERDLTNMDTPLDDVLLDMEDALAFGNKIAELVWAYVENGQDKGSLGLKAMKVKQRRSVAFVTDRYLNIVGILAITPGTGVPVLIGSILTGLQGQITSTPGNPAIDPDKPHILPREKFAILQHEPKDSDPRGTSHLRAAYTAWWGKMQLTPEYLRYLGQWGTPSLVGYTSPGATSVKTTDPVTGVTTTTSAQQAMVNSMVAFRNASTMSFPFGSKVEVLMAHMNPRSFIDDFSHFNGEIAIGIIGQTLASGESGKENLGSAKVHQDILGTLIKQGKKAVERMMVRDVFTPMVIYNEGESARDFIPVASLGETNEPDLGALYAALGQLGFELSPSQFASIDTMLGLPQRSEDELQALTDRALTAVPQVLPAKPSPQQTALNPQNVPTAPKASGAPTGGGTGSTNRNNRAKAGVPA